MDQPQETLIFPHWAGRTKSFIVLLLVMCSLLFVMGLAQILLGPTKSRFDMTVLRIIQTAIWGGMIILGLYTRYAQKRVRTELTPRSLRVIDDKGKVHREMQLADVAELKCRKGLFNEQMWTLESHDGCAMSFDEKLGRNTELAAALESRTGLKFIRVDGEGHPIQAH